MNAYSQFLRDFVAWASAHNPLARSSMEDQLLYRAKNLIAAEVAINERVGKFMTVEEIEASNKTYYCPSSPDGTHIFVFDGGALKNGVCQYCGTDNVNLTLQVG